MVVAEITWSRVGWLVLLAPAALALVPLGWVLLTVPASRPAALVPCWWSSSSSAASVRSSIGCA
jgi:hypothetical protein